MNGRAAIRGGLAAGALWLAASLALAAGGAPVRFALSFDDGPSDALDANPTGIILDALADNPVQGGIKAVFFVLTRACPAQAAARCGALVERAQREGHLLALHDGSPYGHPSHTGLSEDELEASLRDGLSDLMAATGRRATLLRPPYWAYDERTLAAYARHGLAMLLTDASANDGKTWGFRASPRRHGHMASEMLRVRERMQRGGIAAVDGATPVVVTFHDTNDYTAAHMREYLQIIVDAARAAGLALATPPFYGDAAALERALLARDSTRRADMLPPAWRWLHCSFGAGLDCR